MSASRELADSILDEVAPPAIHSVNPSEGVPSNIESFPAPTEPRLQHIVLRMILRGHKVPDIAEVIGKTEEVVIKIAQGEWAKQELDRMAASGGVTQLSVRSLIRLHAFSAARKLGELLDSKNHNIVIQACKLVLEHSIVAAPEKDLDSDKKPVTLDRAKEEEQKLSLAIKALEEKLNSKRA